MNGGLAVAVRKGYDSASWQLLRPMNQLRSFGRAQRSVSTAVYRLWLTLSRKRKSQLVVVVLVMVAASFAEVFSLGMVVPFLAALTAPAQILDNPIASHVLRLFPLVGQGDLVWWLALIFCAATLLSGIIRLLLVYISTRFSFALGADIGLEVYRRTLYQPYSVHVSRHSSQVINGVTTKTNAVINNVIGQILTIFSSTILFAGILSALMVISANITLSAIAAFSVIYGGLIFWTRRRLREDSQVIAGESNRALKALQEGLGGIRDVLLDGTQEEFASLYRDSDRRMRSAQGRMAMTVASPRYLVEALGMICIAILAVVSGGGQSDVVPVLGALALGAQRLLPVVQQAYSSAITIRGSEASLWDVLELLDQPLPKPQPIQAVPFERAIGLSDVRFAYSDGGEQILRKMTLTIPKGSRVGIFGPTGGGKSTVLDILMGLLSPTEGYLIVDDQAVVSDNLRGWQAHIAHVPQTIFLSDASIAENIAFGVPSSSVDMVRVRQVAALAQIDALIAGWNQGYDTKVGERGVQLSGGQRQRIGVARALYKRADVLIFDEATSALDDATERDLMSAIDGLSGEITIVMVAHRLSTLRNCDIVVEIVNGQVARKGTYEELIESKLPLDQGER